MEVDTCEHRVERVGETSNQQTAAANDKQLLVQASTNQAMRASDTRPTGQKPRLGGRPIYLDKLIICITKPSTLPMSDGQL